MTTIVTRAGKGSPLTHTEVDTNFTNLNTNKLETAAIPLGTLAAPSISFVGDANTGAYSPGADTLAFVTAGSNRVHITSGGLVGIGTSTFSYLANKLVIDKGSTANDGITIVSSNTSNASIWFADGTTGSEAYRGGIDYNHSTDKMQIYTGANGNIVIDSAGRLLVGTTTDLSGGDADARLQVNGDAGAQILLSRQDFSALTAGTLIGEVVFRSQASGVQETSALIKCEADATQGSGDKPGRLVFSTTPSGSASPSPRMTITNAGVILGGNTSVNGSHPKAHLFKSTETTDGAGAFIIESSNATNGTSIFVGVGAAGVGYNASNCVLGVYRCNSNSRSINAAGSINASGADYAEYMTKAGDFIIAKGDVCGIDAEGKLTNIFIDSLGFLVKSTDPSYVGGDTWGLGLEDDPEGLETARQAVDRVAFAGQVPVNVMGATPGQYIVPSATEDGGITGIAKDEANLTLAEYMQAVGKVIAIEDDGRARIIVKVA